jgi:hypothetical protein
MPTIIHVHGIDRPASVLRIGNAQVKVWPPSLAPKIQARLEREEKHLFDSLERERYQKIGESGDTYAELRSRSNWPLI